MGNSENPFSIYDRKTIADTSIEKPAGVSYEDVLQTGSVAASVERKFGRLLYLLIFSFILIFVLGIRLFTLQIVKGEEFHSLSEGNRIRLHPIESPRGVIFDSGGEKLVSNIPDFEVRVVPSDLPSEQEDMEQLIKNLARILEIDTDTMAGAFEDFPPISYEPITILEGVNHEQALQMIMVTHTMPGIYVVSSASREYAYPELYSHILGYTGKISETEYEALRGTGYYLTDKVGKTGLEFTYETILRGTYGLEEIEVNSLGIEQSIVATDDPIPGKNLILGIDHQLQQVAHDTLQTAIENTDSPGGTVIAIDPRNGAIRAMVSLPAYDNNTFIGGISQEDYTAYLEDETKPLFNRAIAGTYPSGSTIKPMIAAAALQEGVITEHTSFESTGGLKIQQWFFPDWRAGGHGITDVRKAIADSVNTFFYIVGGGYEDFEGLGIDRIRYYGDLFGFGKTLGIDLPNEADGFLPSPDWKERVKEERWYIGDTYHAAIGQGDVLVTPLQIANYIASIANGGKLIQPHVVEYTEDASGENREAIEPVILNEQVADDYVLQVVREGMRQTVTDGSAKGLQAVSVPVSAKTGTAQFAGEGTHAWITTFAPYDEPELVVTVLVEEGGEGSVTALQIARDVLNAYFNPESITVNDADTSDTTEESENVETD